MKHTRDKIEPINKLASVNELRSERFSAFMKAVNLFAKRYKLREFVNWSKVWEYPWLWFNGLSKVDWLEKNLLDIGSELSPMPWFLASLGAKVTLVEVDSQWIPIWEDIRQQTGLDVNWRIIADEHLPFPDRSFNVVTSFSVIEHQTDKLLAVSEVVRVLKPGGLFALSFDISEPDMGMTFPEWNGRALTMAEFEALIWNHIGFDHAGQKPNWNVQDIPEFIKWNLQSAPHHNYVVGAAILNKKMIIPETIKKILIPRFDTIGDIILLEGFVEALIERLPDAEITLLVREGYEQLAPLFPQKLFWMTTPLNPYKGLEKNNFEDLSEFLGKIGRHSWDLLLTTTYSRTWLDDVVTARLGGVTRIALGEEKEIAGWVERIFSKLHLESQGNYDEVIPVEEDLRETEKYQQFWNKFFKDEKKLPLPKIVIMEDIGKKARGILSELGLNDKTFFLCAPAGTQNVSIKAWPIERFAEIICWITEEGKYQILLIGHESEGEVINKLVEILKEKGIKPCVWTGENGELPVLAALTQMARFYLGNDSGPMHIASAVGIPVVGIFGGGNWPRFVPVGPNSIAVAGKLPCFGCNWECIFEDAPCVRLVGVEDVKKAIRIILSGKAVKSNIFCSSKKISSETAEFVEKAVTKFQFSKSVLMDKLERSEMDRAARLEVTQDLKARFEESEVDREARLKEINRLSEQLQESEMDRAARLEVTQDLKARFEESEVDREARIKEINRLSEQLQESEADRAARLEIIQDLKARFEESEVDREARLKEINRLSEQLQESEADRAARLEMINELRSKLQESEADRAARLEVINKLSAQLQESEADGLARLEVIHKLEAQIRESEADRAIKSEVIKTMQTSFSWRVTAPIRWIYKRIRKGKNY
jgi:ADP-heptose:LPS heptosyltransferase/2-polyprenyl-3-methyl-5-hydroxy-6-metoxy-1,4-benzoquinol methylase/predicted transcriptional regulator